MEDALAPLVRSKYNFFADRRDGVMAYNAGTGTFALLGNDVAEWLQGTGPVHETSDTVALLEMGFLHRGDETARILARGRDRVGDEISLTITPTLSCNRSCEYCYQTEYRTDVTMSPETQDATIRFAVAMVRAGRRTVECTFYGGEPLLAKDIVLSMSRSIQREVERAGGHLSKIGIITNGVLLDKATTAELTNVGVSFAQISIDSLRDDGNKLRGVMDEQGRVSTIVQNAIAATDSLDVKVRVNVSTTNRADLPQIMAKLEEHGLAASAYLARVDDFDGEAGSITDASGLRYRPDKRSLPIVRADAYVLSRPDFARIEYEALLKHPHFLQMITKRLTPRTHSCGATSGALFVIDPSGGISTCWNSVGIMGESIGSVHDVCSEHPEDLRSPFLDYTPLGYTTCAACKVLPLCMGGCSHPRVYLDASKPPCEAIKYQVRDWVNLVGSRLAVQTEST